SYKAFKKLISSKKDLLPEIGQEAYYVTLSNVIYNFENQGILLSLDLANLKNIHNLSVQRILDTPKQYFKKNYHTVMSGMFLTSESLLTSVSGDLLYKPRSNYERLVTNESFIVFYEMPLEKATTILKSGGIIYIVRKIKIFNDLTFTMNSPIIELYKDKALSDKIGTLNYNDLIFY
ncbi:MAG: hypothetical protein KDC67_13470, partial [Ignavibacteriae bacterium]|nr:hypothetical protein [Ignavibacteriota bacterium]